MHLSPLTDRSSLLIVPILSGQPPIYGWWAPMGGVRAGFGVPPNLTSSTITLFGPQMGNVSSISMAAKKMHLSKAVMCAGRML